MTAQQWLEKHWQCSIHPFGRLPEGKGLWEVAHGGCDWRDGGCDCYCGINCIPQWSNELVEQYKKDTTK